MILISPEAFGRLMSKNKQHSDINKPESGMVGGKEKEKLMENVNAWIKKKRQLDLDSIMNRRRNKSAWNNAQMSKMYDKNFSKVETFGKPAPEGFDSIMTEDDEDDDATDLSNLMTEDDSLNLELQDNLLTDDESKQNQSASLSRNNMQLVPHKNFSTSTPTNTASSNISRKRLLQHILNESFDMLSPNNDSMKDTSTYDILSDISKRYNLENIAKKYNGKSPLVQRMDTSNLPDYSQKDRLALVPYSTPAQHSHTSKIPIGNSQTRGPVSTLRAIEYPLHVSPKVVPGGPRKVKKSKTKPEKSLDTTTSPISSRVKRRANRATTQKFEPLNWKSIPTPRHQQQPRKKK